MNTRNSFALRLLAVFICFVFILTLCAPVLAAQESGKTTAKKRPTNIVYTKRLTNVYEKTSSSKPKDEILMGERLIRLDVRKEHTEVLYGDNKTGFVLSTDVEYMNDTGAYEFTNLNDWRYSKGVTNYAYLIPMQKEHFRVGYMNNNEAVWALAENGYWTMLYANGRVSFVPTDTLNKKPTNKSKEKVSTGPYSPGDEITLKQAVMPYSTFSLKYAYVPYYEATAYRKISQGTKVYIMLCTEKYAQILWMDDRDCEPGQGVNFYAGIHSAFVKLSDLK